MIISFFSDGKSLRFFKAYFIAHSRIQQVMLRSHAIALNDFMNKTNISLIKSKESWLHLSVMREFTKEKSLTKKVSAAFKIFLT